MEARLLLFPVAGRASCWARPAALALQLFSLLNPIIRLPAKSESQGRKFILSFIRNNSERFQDLIDSALSKVREQFSFIIIPNNGYLASFAAKIFRFNIRELPALYRA
jgi:hypothetical protein